MSDNCLSAMALFVFAAERKCPMASSSLTATRHQWLRELPAYASRRHRFSVPPGAGFQARAGCRADHQRHQDECMRRCRAPRHHRHWPSAQARRGPHPCGPSGPALRTKCIARVHRQRWRRVQGRSKLLAVRPSVSGIPHPHTPRWDPDAPRSAKADCTLPVCPSAMLIRF